MRVVLAARFPRAGPRRVVLWLGLHTRIKRQDTTRVGAGRSCRQEQGTTVGTMGVLHSRPAVQCQIGYRYTCVTGALRVNVRSSQRAHAAGRFGRHFRLRFAVLTEQRRLGAKTGGGGLPWLAGEARNTEHVACCPVRKPVRDGAAVCREPLQYGGHGTLVATRRTGNVRQVGPCGLVQSRCRPPWCTALLNSSAFSTPSSGPVRSHNGRRSYSMGCFRLCVVRNAGVKAQQDECTREPVCRL